MKKLAIIASSLAGVSVLAMGGMGVASAATSTNNSGNVGTSDIPRSVYQQERLDAAAEVLNTSTTIVQNAHKGKTMNTLITNAGLTKTTFATKVKAQLTTDLESKGYSGDQVTIALQHKQINHLRHKVKS